MKGFGPPNIEKAEMRRMDIEVDFTMPEAAEIRPR
jgi:hypothetical protein